jgi:predicted dehydrogenase
MHALPSGSGALSRREFIRAAGLAAAAFSIVPRRVLGGPGYTAPSDTLNVAIIGAGGQGTQNLRELLQQPDVRIPAICDVAESVDYSAFYYGGLGGRLPAIEIVERSQAEKNSGGGAFRCAGYSDFRRMLEQEKAVDAVLVATPDHTHAVAVLAAIRNGKHVYCEKPLAHSVREVRKIMEESAAAGVSTQMGNQGHSGEGIRLTVEWLAAGAIGPVREVHSWSYYLGPPACRAGRPADTPPVPSGMDWGLWIGPAPTRPYHPAYAPFNWRDWWDFGTDVIGDMGCHNMDPAFWGLELGAPKSVHARVVPADSEMTPYASTVHYEFGARGDKPPVRMTWYSMLMPPRPEELEPGRDLTGDGNGILFVGDRGKIMCGGWGGSPRLIPESRMKDFIRPARTLPRSRGHHRDWIEACKGGPAASSNFQVAGPMVEAVLLGAAAIRSNKYLEWNSADMKVANCSDADLFIHPEYRNGWTL